MEISFISHYYFALQKRIPSLIFEGMRFVVIWYKLKLSVSPASLESSRFAR